MSSFRETAQSLDRAMLRGATHAFLKLSTLPYGAAIWLRNSTFESGARASRRVSVPVLSIGNITTGGTGKTPVVAWLVNLLSEHHVPPAIVSRGYRAVDASGNDEKKILDRLCPGIPHRQNRSRFRAAQSLLHPHLADAIVLDDGFQHRQLHRDLDIVLIDCTNPWGGNQLLPLGRLREPLRSLSRADYFLLTRCELVTPEKVAEITLRLRAYSSQPILRTAFVPSSFSNGAGESISIEELLPRRVLAFCGIGNPQGFRKTLKQLGFDIPAQQFLTFPDHHHYTPDDLARIAAAARQTGCAAILATHKDLVKIQSSQLEGIPLWGLDQQLSFQDDITGLLNQLRTLFPQQFRQTGMSGPRSC